MTAYLTGFDNTAPVYLVVEVFSLMGIS